MCTYGYGQQTPMFTFDNYSDYQLIFAGKAITCDTIYFVSDDTLRKLYGSDYKLMKEVDVYRYKVIISELIKGKGKDTIIIELVGDRVLNCGRKTIKVHLNEDMYFICGYFRSKTPSISSWSCKKSEFNKSDLAKIKKWAAINSAIVEEKYYAEELKTDLYKKGLIKKGQLEGKWTLSFKDGEIIDEGYYKNGIIDSLWLSYYTGYDEQQKFKSKILAGKTFYRDSKQCSISYDINGKIDYAYCEKEITPPSSIYTKEEIEKLIESKNRKSD